MKTRNGLQRTAMRLMAATMAMLLSLIAVLPAQAASIPAAAADATYYAPVFNAAYYAEKYSDLKTVYGNDEAALLNHFIAFGMAEGRQGCEEFDVKIYKEKYEDLQAAFGDDLVSYYMHYIIAGKAEGRTATAPKPAATTTTTGIRDGWDVNMAFEIFNYENMSRQSAGLKLLIWDGDMVITAQKMAYNLLTNYTYDTSRYTRVNIGRGANNAYEVLNGSPEFGSGWDQMISTRMNIMDQEHRQTAIGVYVDGSGKKYVVQIFK